MTFEVDDRVRISSGSPVWHHFAGGARTCFGIVKKVETQACRFGGGVKRHYVFKIPSIALNASGFRDEKFWVPQGITSIVEGITRVEEEDSEEEEEEEEEEKGQDGRGDGGDGGMGGGGGGGGKEMGGGEEDSSMLQKEGGGEAGERKGEMGGKGAEHCWELVRAIKQKLIEVITHMFWLVFCAAQPLWHNHLSCFLIDYTAN